MDFPIRPEQHIFETDSLTLLRNELPRSWLIRELSERDYGIDLYVEIVGKTGELRGDMVALQLKGKKKIVFKGGRAHLKGVKRSTLNYWLSLPVPVFVCIVCLTKKKCYWVNVCELNRRGAFGGSSKTIVIPVREQCDFDAAHGMPLFQVSYLRERKWPQIEAAIEKGLTLYNTLGPLVLMCKRSPDDIACSTTLQYLINDHYECYSLLSHFLLGATPKRLPDWYDKNFDYVASQGLPATHTFYFKTMKEMLSAMLDGYRECLLRAYAMVMETHHAYFATKFVYLCMHLRERPHTFVADDWYTRYFFDEYENETEYPEKLFFADFDEFDGMLETLHRS